MRPGGRRVIAGIRLLAALAVLLAVWVLPLAWWLGTFPAHMLRHAAVVAVAPALLAPLLPPRGAPPVLLAAGAEFALAWGWHLPGPHLATLVSTLWLLAEQGSLLLGGLAVWWSAWAARPLGGAAALVATSMHMTMLGALLLLAGRALYPYCDLDQQQVGAMLMLAIVCPVYLVGALLRARRALEEGVSA